MFSKLLLEESKDWEYLVFLRDHFHQCKIWTLNFHLVYAQKWKDKKVYAQLSTLSKIYDNPA